MSSQEPENEGETRQERRDRKLRSKRARMKKHGKNLAQIYLDAISKKLKGKG